MARNVQLEAEKIGFLKNGSSIGQNFNSSFKIRDLNAFLQNNAPCRFAFGTRRMIINIVTWRFTISLLARDY